MKKTTLLLAGRFFTALSFSFVSCDQIDAFIDEKFPIKTYDSGSWHWDRVELNLVSETQTYDDEYGVRHVRQQDEYFYGDAGTPEQAGINRFSPADFRGTGKLVKVSIKANVRGLPLPVLIMRIENGHSFPFGKNYFNGRYELNSDSVFFYNEESNENLFSSTAMIYLNTNCSDVVFYYTIGTECTYSDYGTMYTYLTVPNNYRDSSIILEDVTVTLSTNYHTDYSDDNTIFDCDKKRASFFPYVREESRTSAVDCIDIPGKDEKFTVTVSGVRNRTGGDTSIYTDEFEYYDRLIMGIGYAFYETEKDSHTDEYHSYRRTGCVLDHTISEYGLLDEFGVHFSYTSEPLTCSEIPTEMWFYFKYQKNDWNSKINDLTEDYYISDLKVTVKRVE